MQASVFRETAQPYFVFAVDGHEPALRTDDAEMSGKSGNTAPAVAAHGAFATIGIEVNHLEVVAWQVLQQDQAVGANTEAPVAQALDFPGMFTCKPLLGALIDQVGPLVPASVKATPFTTAGEPLPAKSSRCE